MNEPHNENDDAASRPDEPEPTEAGHENGGDPARPAEIGGPPGPEPTRYGDWERRGRCIDF